jgi:hypothetical protein
LSPYPAYLVTPSVPLAPLRAQRAPAKRVRSMPGERTSSGCLGMSEKCQEATLERHPDGAFYCSAHAKTLASLGRQSPIAVQDCTLRLIESDMLTFGTAALTACAMLHADGVATCDPAHYHETGTSKLTYVLESNSLVSCDVRCGQEHH